MVARHLGVVEVASSNLVTQTIFINFNKSAFHFIKTEVSLKMKNNIEKFYITTAIAYASKKPHIGNTYEIILTDAIARFKKMQGFDVCFCTGTDEHGQKIEQIAKEKNIEPQVHVNLISSEIERIWKLLNCEFDLFIRTTDPHHVKIVKQIFKKLFDQGDIYKSSYEGWYCVADESFLADSQVVDEKCPECGRKVVKTKEEAYFFKVDKYKEQLLNHINSHNEFIYPSFYRDEIVNNFFKTGLRDFCVSRSSFKWGIPIDFDSNCVVYVWLDALINYITALGFELNENCCSGKFKKFWPANLQIVGKDILRFHAIIWPMILMALNLPLPKQILAHQWIICKDGKMSKTSGNVIYADELVDLFSTDAVRYYVLNAISTSHDGIISYEDIIDVYNMDLANTIGNLVKRSCDMAYKYFNGNIIYSKNETEINTELKTFSEKCYLEYENLMNTYKISDSIAVILSLARFCNKFIEKKAPWTMAKKSGCKAQLNSILFNLIEAIRFIGIMLLPIMPESAEKILKQIGAKNRDLNSLKNFGGECLDAKIEKPEVLFSRIDKEKKLKEIKIYNGV